MRFGWLPGLHRTLKTAAVATALATAALAGAQDIAPTAAPEVAAATAAAPAATGTTAAAVAAVGEAAAQHMSTQADAIAGYTRMAPTPGIGQPVDKGWQLQEQFTPIGQEAAFLTDMILNPLIVVISLFVLALMAWVCFRYRAAANPVPSKTTHNFTIEVVWTLIPAIILLFVAVPSFRLLANQYDPPKADVTIKVTGYQWYWGYEYPDYGGISFDALPLSKADAEKEGVPYLLDTDNRVVVPAGKTVKLLITAGDVLHSWAIPAFWVKMDAVPGKINETWFKVDRPGVYYGQCSELCGTKHGFMPITVEVLPEEQFKAWVRMKQKADGIEPTGPGIAVAPALSPAAVAAAVRSAVTPAGAPQIVAPEGAPALPAPEAANLPAPAAAPAA
jgi:cytochrome c oxidase subunit II